MEIMMGKMRRVARAPDPQAKAAKADLCGPEGSTGWVLFRLEREPTLSTYSCEPEPPVSAPHRVDVDESPATSAPPPTRSSRLVVGCRR